MDRKLKSLQLNTLINLVLGAVYILASIVIVISVNTTMKKEALFSAELQARILIDRNLATHTYFTHDLKPKIFELVGSGLPKDYFEPAWMSSSYAIRKIDEYFRSLTSSDFYYKDAAINARNPGNEASMEEKAFMRELVKDPLLERKTHVTNINGKPYLVIMRKGEIFDNSCLRCHSTPEKAPGNLVQLYGRTRSFNRQPGDLASIVSIHIPLAEAYANVDRFTIQLSLILLFVLISVFLIRYLLYRSLLFQPLMAIREKAQLIATKDAHLGEEIREPYGRELKELVTSFNRMSVHLRDSMDHLEARVLERTAELSTLNARLEKEIGERKVTELEKEILIEQYKSALANIRTLKGLLPICASCKKVRNDQGYWEQIESYVREHSDAEFSHGICPECRERLYPKKENPGG